MGKIDWQQTVMQAAKGDRDAFEKLYEQTERSVYFTCLKLIGNEHDAKDVMQDTYMKAFQKLSELSDYSKFHEWIKRIAVNNCKTLFRRQTTDYLEDCPEQAAEIAYENDIIPSDYVSDAAKRHIIMNIIDTELSDIQRQTIILYYYDEMSVAEIAEIMGCPEGTVKYRLSAAREKIREAVLIYENENDDKLHALIPIPVLTSILRKEAEEISVPRIQLFGSEVSSPKRGTGKNSNLNMKGQNTMTNAIKGKIIAGAAAAVIVGGGVTAALVINSSKTDSIQTDSVISSAAESESSAAETSASAAESSTTDESSEAEVIKTEIDESDLHDWYIRYYRPSDFWPFPGSGEIFHMKTEKGNEICMVRDTVDIFYLQRHEVEDFVLEDVPEIMDPLIIENLQRFSSRFYYEIGSRSEFDVETEEKREVIGTTFLRRTGVIHAMAYGNHSGDYYYITYYGIIDKSIDTGHYNAPICWTMVTDDKTQIPEIERIADTIAEYAEPVE